LMDINCQTYVMEVGANGACSVPTSTALDNFDFTLITKSLMFWILNKTGDGTLSNPVCDMIEAGYTEDEVEAYLSFLKIAMENEPDPGYDSDDTNDPYSAYNIITNNYRANKVTQFLLDYPCVKPFEHLGLLLSDDGVVDWAIDFLAGDCGDEGKVAYVNLTFKVLKTDNAYKPERFTDLFNILSTVSANDLLSDCGDDLTPWMDLANFVPPQNVLDKLVQLGEGWRLQSFLEPTAAPSINMDYFSTTITQMPINPETGQQWSPDDLFHHLRTNINDFVDTDNSTFTPIQGDESLWLSDNPVSAVITINIDLPLGFPGDDGSVICAQNESCCWIFSTVKAPHFPITSDGLHPVSGNRQFGYLINSDGHMEIYTRGVDRFLVPTAGYFSSSYQAEKLAGYLLEKLAFNGADDLWESFQQRISEFAKDPQNGGSALINIPIKKRPKANNELKNALKSYQAINYIPCEN